MKYFLPLILLIIIRHDSSDRSHLSLAKQFEPYVAAINLPDCEGTIVGRNVVITAAHCAVEVERKLQEFGGHSILLKGRPHTVSKVRIHPNFKTDQRYDIALIWFDSNTTRYKTAELNFPALEVNDTIYIAGRGMTGNGKKGIIKNDGKLRAGKNLLDFKSDFWLGWRFDPPGEKRSLPLEAISGPGDSGGAAFIKINDSFIIVGISSWQSSIETRGRNHLYGVTEFYTRISSYRDWLCSLLL